MKANNRQKKARYQKPKTPKPSRQAMQTKLVAALAPLYSAAHAQLRMDLALTHTASNTAQQVVALFAEAAQRTSVPVTTKTLMDEAEEDMLEALEELDKSDPFDPSIFGGKAGFGEGADFPRVCFKNWKEQMRNYIEAHHKIKQRLIEQGDPEAHQHANDAMRNTSIAISESLSRCLRSPIRKLPVPTP